MQTTSGPVYFDAEIEFRTDNEWKKLLKDNLFVRASDYIDNVHAPLVYAVGEMASQMGYPFDAIYNLEEGIRLGITSATRGPNARQRQIKAELARQNAIWPELDGAFILNWYATYEKKIFGGKVQIVNYQRTNRWELY